MTMATPNIDKLLADYKEFAERSLVRVKRAATEVRRRDYSSGKLVSDTLDFWLDVADLARSPYDAVLSAAKEAAGKRSGGA
jgi:hypothetical protein